MARYSASRNQMIRDEDAQDYTANGAISIRDGVHRRGGAGARARTLAAPTAGDEGTQITVTAMTAAAHTLTITGGIGGRGAAVDVVTYTNIGDSITLKAVNLVWAPIGAPYGATIA
jgi:hypothetical protein